ncbi:MAG: hypothetical protein KGJ80_02640 [Chloroflexota bacterium]|nr:hypothetical protein [Chloroflexota bacterium]
MTALVSFVRVYAVWIYLLCAFGILFGLKMLTDARRLARTTLFSLEQERATEQSYRAVLLIVILLAAMGAVTGVNFLIAPGVPSQEPPILRGASPTLPAFVFPSNTPLPTATFTPPPASETPFITSTPIITSTATRAPRPATLPAPPTAAPTVPAPTLTAPPNGNVFTGEGQANAAMTFKWKWNCDQCSLGPDDKYVLTILYVDKSGKPMVAGGSTRNDYLVMADIVRGGYYLWQQAKEDKFQWYVQVKRGEQPLTPQSETWVFTWH